MGQWSTWIVGGCAADRGHNCSSYKCKCNVNVNVNKFFKSGDKHTHTHTHTLDLAPCVHIIHNHV